MIYTQNIIEKLLSAVSSHCSEYWMPATELSQSQREQLGSNEKNSEDVSWGMLSYENFVWMNSYPFIWTLSLSWIGIISSHPTANNNFSMLISLSLSFSMICLRFLLCRVSCTTIEFPFGMRHLNLFADWSSTATTQNKTIHVAILSRTQNS